MTKEEDVIEFPSPTEQKIRRELAPLAELCVRGGSPFKELREKKPFNTYPATMQNVEPELRKKLEGLLIVVAQCLITGQANREAAEELHKFYSQARKEFIPRSTPFDSRISATEAQRTIESLVSVRLPEFRVCEFPIRLPKKAGQGRRIVSLGKEVLNGKMLFILLDPSEKDFAIYFGISDPFFSLNIGNFWGLGRAAWLYEREPELTDGLVIALGAVTALLPFVQEAVQRGLE